MGLQWAARTELGLVRPNNEDSWVAHEDLGLFAVADGVGGRPAGEVASNVATTVLTEACRTGMDLEAAFRLATEVVRRLGETNSLFSRMCTTLTAVTVSGNRARIAHVGDTAAWLIRNGSSRELTEDQTVGARLLRSGEITAEALLDHPKRHTLFQCIGWPAEELEVDLTEIELSPGDRLVLATDGLDYAGPPDLLAKLMTEPGSPTELTDALVDAALAAGGNDNITVIALAV